MVYLYAARNFSTLVGLASPEPMATMYSASFFRATWVLTALDAGFWTAMKVPTKKLRDLASIVFSVFYLFAAERADEKVRKVRGNLTVEHLRVSWNKGSESPYLRLLQGLMRPRFTRWPPRAVRIPRPAGSDYKDAVLGWLYFDGPLANLERHNKIVLDIPGGGFVAMDPRCNDDRLLAWAAKTGVPVLSLDYKKAPEYPYPYALNECYDVYTTLIKSRGRCIGLSGKDVPRIVVSGDSAGGNLATAMVLMVMESGATPWRRFQGQSDLPSPEGLVLFYPALDMNIGNWMSDEQMALIQDRRMRTTNKRIARRKSMQYNELVGTPHHSDDEDESPSEPQSILHKPNSISDSDASSPVNPRSPHPEFSKVGPSQPHRPAEPPSPGVGLTLTTSHHPEPLRTRLAMSSMISYFNDRVLTPETMRAMIILYIGPHNRPDFSPDYLLSPSLAPDLLLARFPKTCFLTGERDPLVDDTVLFAARLRRVRAAFLASGGRRVEYQDADAECEGFDDKDAAEVALLPGTSHGFLQFPSIYPPAWRLIDRAGAWVEELFAGAEGRERRRRRAFERAQPQQHQQQQQQQDGGRDGPVSASHDRHHRRQESSGDEDRPLEMSMTKSRGRKASKEAQGTNGGHGAQNGAGVNGGQVARDSHGGESEDGKSLTPRPRRKRTNGKTVGDDLLPQLKSSDDLLGRRMQGLVGGLQGLREDD
jgi:acetyl esterase/lipase